MLGCLCSLPLAEAGSTATPAAALSSHRGGLEDVVQHRPGKAQGTRGASPQADRCQDLPKQHGAPVASAPHPAAPQPHLLCGAAPGALRAGLSSPQPPAMRKHPPAGDEQGWTSGTWAAALMVLPTTTQGKAVHRPQPTITASQCQDTPTNLPMQPSITRASPGAALLSNMSPVGLGAAVTLPVPPQHQWW